MSDAQRYQVIERLAAGGMAEVYRGESAGIEGFRKKVAIKRVLPKLSANREFINMFLDEARLGAYLSHSRCVQVFDIGQAGGAHFIVMEYVDGADLKETMEYLTRHGQTLPVEVACYIAQSVCEGLDYAHTARDHTGQPLNIVHRDISPHNVLMTRHGEVKLVDFGLAKAGSHLSAEDEDIVKGKFGYLAPEVTLGKGADHRVDIFAAGILLWEMLCGRRLFHGESDVDTFKLVRAAEIPDPRSLRPDVTAEVVTVVGKALARDPSERYSSAGDMARDLGVVILGLGRSVTYRDVARYVNPAADERNAKRKTQSKTAAGVIGDLILDTLHDFSGVIGEVLDEQPSSLEPAAASQEGSSFEDPSAWGLEDLFDAQPKKAPSPAEAAPRVAPRAPEPPPREVAEAAPPPPVNEARARPAEASALRPPKSPAAAPAPATEPRAERAAPPARKRAEPPADEKKEGPFWRRWFG